MASRQFLEDGTEGPFIHIVRSPPALFERTSNRRMGRRTSSGSWPPAISQDCVTRKRHIRLSGLPSGCLRWRRGRRQRRLLRWRRWHLGPATSPANEQGNQDQGGDDRHSRDGRVESERRAGGEREVRGHLS